MRDGHPRLAAAVARSCRGVAGGARSAGVDHLVGVDHLLVDLPIILVVRAVDTEIFQLVDFSCTSPYGYLY